MTNTSKNVRSTTKKPASVVLSLGGSLLVPDGVDASYIKDFAAFVKKQQKAFRMVIFTGGGRTARNYQQALREINPKANNTMLDWVGIEASHVNAAIVKQSLGGLAHDTVIRDPRVTLRWSKPVWLGAGWKPGRSTDYDAVRIAVENNIKRVINLSNISHVYTADPRKDPKATKIEEMGWAEFRKLVGTTWDPGLNVPFDPIAAKLAQQAGIEVMILDGSNLANVAKAMRNDATAVGTRLY